MTSLILVLIDEYGTEALEWDPETIKLEIEEDFHVDLPNDSLDKICAGCQIIGSDSFYKSLPDFIEFCNILSDDSCDYETWAPADVYDIVSAMAEVRLISPPLGPIEEMLDPEIAGYITVELRDAHVIEPPECLSFIPASALAINDIGKVSDDPDMFSAGYETALEASDELQLYETALLQRLLQELSELQLEHGDLSWLKKDIQREEQKSGPDQTNRSILEI